VGVTLAVRDPEAVAARWGEVLGVPARDGYLALDGGHIEFAADPAEPGLTEIAVALPPEVRRGRDEVLIGGVRFRLLEDDGEEKR
jgi:catechol 2,3-dioxygenase-like lactoylglutathione lyase family enzyme